MAVDNVLILRVCHDLITPFNAINLGLDAFEITEDRGILHDIKESADKDKLFHSCENGKTIKS